MVTVAYWVVKIAFVIVLLGVAAAFATPKGRLPLALRGLEKLVRKDRGEDRTAHPAPEAPSGMKRFFAFVLVIIAILIAAL